LPLIAVDQTQSDCLPEVDFSQPIQLGKDARGSTKMKWLLDAGYSLSAEC